jgi:hypothetical protein
MPRNSLRLALAGRYNDFSAANGTAAGTECALMVPMAAGAIYLLVGTEKCACR